MGNDEADNAAPTIPASGETYDSSIEANKNREKQIDEVQRRLETQDKDLKY